MEEVALGFSSSSSFFSFLLLFSHPHLQLLMNLLLLQFLLPLFLSLLLLELLQLFLSALLKLFPLYLFLL